MKSTSTEWRLRHLVNLKFEYVNADNTNLSERFRLVREAMALQAKADQAQPAKKNVRRIR